MAKTQNNQIDMRGLEILADEFTGRISSPLVTALVLLTDNSGGTANNTIEVVPAASAATTDTSAASLTSVNLMVTALRNDMADLTAKVNAIITALKT